MYPSSMMCQCQCHQHPPYRRLLGLALAVGVDDESMTLHAVDARKRADGERRRQRAASACDHDITMADHAGNESMRR